MSVRTRRDRQHCSYCGRWLHLVADGQACPRCGTARGLVGVQSSCEACCLLGVTFHNGDQDNVCQHPGAKDVTPLLDDIPFNCPLKAGDLVVSLGGSDEVS